ncbi:MAG TPA: hypothetical protein PLZ24_16320 [Flavobacteriales bacterium]|nr:hypothetical protein [Flavobacteriales bacterium]
MSTYLAIWFAICAFSLSIAMVEKDSGEEWWRYWDEGNFSRHPFQNDLRELLAKHA